MAKTEKTNANQRGGMAKMEKPNFVDKLVVEIVDDLKKKAISRIDNELKPLVREELAKRDDELSQEIAKNFVSRVTEKTEKELGKIVSEEIKSRKNKVEVEILRNLRSMK